MSWIVGIIYLVIAIIIYFTLTFASDVEGESILCISLWWGCAIAILPIYAMIDGPNWLRGRRKKRKMNIMGWLEGEIECRKCGQPASDLQRCTPYEPQYEYCTHCGYVVEIEAILTTTGKLTCQSIIGMDPDDVDIDMITELFDDAPSDDQLNDDDDTTVPDVIFYTPTPRVIAADRFKHPISVGDTICYPVRQGSMMWMRDMVVVDSQHNKIQGRIINEDGTEGRLVTISKMSHVTKL